VIRARSLEGRRLSAVALAVAIFALTASTLAAQTPARVLGREEILLYGLGLRVEPSTQVVPKDIATIVSTYLQAPSDPGAQLPPFAPDAEIRATLRGPTFQTPVDLTTKPNSPFTIPPLTTPGLHTLDNIRLVSSGQVLLYGSPESVSIEVIEKLLVTQVTARPLTAAEIKERGLVFDKSSYQAYNFTAAFAIEDHPVTIDFPIVLPTMAGAQGVPVAGTMMLESISGPSLTLPTLLPDTLKLQAQIPNLSVTGFVLRAPVSQDKQLIVPPIPGVIVIPGDIGFLNQFFSIMLMVANVAPSGSNLVVSDLQAEIVLPPGNDDVVGSADDPLRMASTAEGEWPRIRVVAQAGPDGKLGTADDILTLGPGETGHAEYLVEGRREGSAIVEMALSGTLTGLPIGPVTIMGRAAGAVLVRNPKFTLTFTHPEIVSAGEQYTLDATVTNTSMSPANFVSVNLYGANISGAALIGEGTREIEYIAAGDSATVSFTLVSKRSGRVTAATMDSDENVAGRFALKTSVGELGIPLSPDSLVLPKEANSLPAGVREAALGLLGKAHAVATAPPAALPKDVQRFTRKIVWDRAIEVAQAGMRVSLHEPVADSVAHLAMDFLGNNRARLAELYPKPGDLAFVANDVEGFDALRRTSVRGDTFAAAVATVLSPEIERLGVAPFHTELAQTLAWRPGHISILIGGTDGTLPVRLTLIDSGGRRVTDTTAGAGKVTKSIPYSDLLRFTDGSAVTGQLAIVASPDAGRFSIRLEREPGVPDTATFALSVVAPDAAGTLRQYVFPALAVTDHPEALGAAGDPFRFTFELLADGSIVQGRPIAAPPPTSIPDQPPEVLGIVQQADADLLKIGEEVVGRPGRVVAVLFSEEVTPESVQDQKAAADITHFAPDQNAVVGVALQPGRRIAYLALRDPVGPLIARSIVMSDIADRTGKTVVSQATPIETTVSEAGGVVTGQVLKSDGTPLAFANVRLFYEFTRVVAEAVESPLSPGEIIQLDEEQTHTFGISSKTTDDQGRFSWDYVLAGPTVRIAAFNADTEEYQSIRVSIARNGQRLNVNLPFLGRGSLKGRTLAEDGTTPLGGTSLLVTSLTDQSQYFVLTDSTGAFDIQRIPVGNVLIEAVNPSAGATVKISERIPFAGAEITRDIILIGIDVAQPVQRGRVTGHVLQADGATVAVGAQVVLYYREDARYPVYCPEQSSDGITECAVAVTRTDALGAFTFEQVPPGSLRVYAFDQPTLMQGEVLVELAPGGSVSFNLLLAGGLGTVSGTVVDSAGQPVAGARVGGGLSLTTTDTSGHFTLTDVPVGRSRLVAVSDALGSVGGVDIDIARQGETISAVIVLQAAGVITGIVRDSSGTPVPNLDVYLLNRPDLAKGGENSIAVRSSTTTEANGRYRFERVVAGEYRVSAFNPDFTDGNVADAVLSYQGQVVTAAITFRGRGHIHGVVYDADGHTPLRAAVGLSGDQLVIAGNRVGAGFVYVQNYQIAESTITDGAFTFNGVWVGPFTLRAAGQFSPDPIAYEATMPPPGGEVNLTLRLQPTSEIRGTVLQPDGVTPVGGNVIVRYKSGAFVIRCITVGSGEGAYEVCSPYPQGIQEETVVTDEHGQFWLPTVNASSFTLTVEDPVSGKVGQVSGTVRAGGRAELTVRLLGTGEVTVQVFASDASTPIPGARVKVNQIGFPGRSFEFIADSQGRVVFSGADALTEGAFVVAAVDLRDGFAGRAMGRVTQDGEQLLVRVYLYNAAGAVAGIVYKADGLDPAPNVQVIVSNERGPLAYAMTDAAGSFRVDTIPLGDFSVECFNPATAGRAYGAGRIDLDRQEVALNLTEAAVSVVRGTVIDAFTLEPLKGWTVELNQQSPSGRDLPTLVTTSGVDGGFSFPGATVGSFSLTVWYSQGGVYARNAMRGALTRPAEAVDVVVPVDVPHPAYGRIDGLVVNPDGSPAGNSQVEIWASTLAQSLVTTGDGTFTVDDVPVGRFQVVAISQVTGTAGSVVGDLQFEGQTAKVTVVMIGLSRVSGTVVKADGSPSAGAEVTLSGQPASGCLGDCVVFADAAGAFTFLDVPAKTFTVTARDPISNLKGAVGGSLSGGETRVVRVVLEPSAIVRGRVLFSNGGLALGVVADLSRPAPWDSSTTQRLFVESRSDGVFEFSTVAIGTWNLSLQDPAGSGLARRTVAVTGLMDLRDIVLDEAPPMVTGMTPAASSAGVPRDQMISIVFSEPVSPTTVNGTTVVLSEAAGTVAGLVDLTAGDKTVTFTPLVPLKDQTRYTVRVSGVKDRLDKPMSAAYVASFTTIDVKPPGWSVVSPAQGTSGVAVDTTVRVTFSEPIDPQRFTATPVRASSATGAVEGRIDFLNGNTTVAFSPRWPLAEATVYRVQVDPAADLSGNLQAAGLDFEFRTTDRTPPTVAGLVPADSATVIENGFVSITPTLGAGHDVSYVDYYANGVFRFTSRTSPFTFALQATPSFGKAGDLITVWAVAVDTSGNRGVASAPLAITILPDAAPVVSIVAPIAGLSARNGERVVVTVRASDDVGVAQIGYRAATGRPQDAVARAVTPAVLAREESFEFVVPANLAPGATIAIQASAADTQGQITNAASVNIAVLDAVPPTVAITGATSGDRIRPGQSASVVVAAQDMGGVSAVTFATSGLVSGTQTRTIDPAQNSLVTTFAVTAPMSAQPGDVIRLDASATDKTGNTGSAARVLLAVADAVPPTIRLRTETGRLDMSAGQTVTLIADADDETGVARIDLVGQGAFQVADTQAVSPPSGSASVQFTINVPSGVAAGATLSLHAKAYDISGNASVPTDLTLTAISVAEVILPPTLVVLAGDTVDLTVQLAAPARAGGTTVALRSAAPEMAWVPASVSFAEGEQSKTVAVSGLLGGIVQIDALIQGVPRATTSVTVIGGVVRGVVLDPQLNPVAGAQVTVKVGWVSQTTETDGAGRYIVQGLADPSDWRVTVRARDPHTQLIGFNSGILNGPDGHVTLNVVLLSAAILSGTVVHPDGTPAGANVRVDLYAAGNLEELVSTTSTDATGAWEFPLVSVGDYVLDASDGAGNLGRSTAHVGASGEEVVVQIMFLGRGAVTGIVRDGVGNPIAGALVEMRLKTALGLLPPTTATAGLDGRYRFEGVYVGGFALTATDPISGQGGTASGAVSRDLEEVSLDIRLAPFANLTGTIYRPDGVTDVGGGVTVTFDWCQWQGQRDCTAFTATDLNGRYEFRYLPLKTFAFFVQDPATRGLGFASGTLAVTGETRTLNVTLYGQGTIIATVTNGSGTPVAGALVGVQAVIGRVTDTLSGTTGADGQVIFQHVLAAGFTVTATAGGVTGTATGSLAAGEIKNLMIPLEPSGSIAGRVLQPDGVTLASAVFVELTAEQAPFNSYSATLADGTFRFDQLKLGKYTLRAYDGVTLDRLRALAKGLLLSAGGQVVTADVTFAGLGTVVGRVLNPDSSSASNIEVQAQSLNPDFGNFGTALTDAAGYYVVPEMVVGTVAVKAGNPALDLLGEATGTLAGHGDTVTVDILLANNAVNMPRYRYDANASYYQILGSGAVNDAVASVFYGDGSSKEYGFLLDLISGGTTLTFSGGSIGRTEDGGREIAVRQDGLAGLNVVRKVFVPATGYFVRHLELLSNPTVEPITVGVQVRSHAMATVGSEQIITSSDGDTLLTVGAGDSPDRWLTVDDGADGDPVAQSGAGTPALAFVFDGQGAVARAGTATFAGGTVGVLSYEWQNITVPAGGTVALMHFGSQQTSRAAAQLSAERLVLLPPEALAGMNPSEMAAIVNFAVPADGHSLLDRLPEMGGSVTGRVLAGDGTTPIMWAPVIFQSANPFFGRQHQYSSSYEGTYSVAPQGVENWLVPLDSFTLVALHPDNNALQSPGVSGSFAPSETTAVQDIVFSNLGLVGGTVHRRDGTVVTGGTVTISRLDPPVSISTSINGDGTFLFTGVPQGTLILSAGQPTPVLVTAGQLTTMDLLPAPTGTLDVTLRDAGGAPAPGRQVGLNSYWSGGVSRSVTTDTSGHAVFTEVPEGTFNLNSYDSYTGAHANAVATIVADQTTTADLRYWGSGTFAVHVQAARGVGVPGASVKISSYTWGNTYYKADGLGTAVAANLYLGTYTVEVAHPTITTLKASTLATLTANGVTVPLTLVLPASASVRVTARRDNGTAFAGAYVLAKDSARSEFWWYGTTDAAGQYTIASVRQGPFVVRVIDSSTSRPLAEVSGTISAADDGQVIDVAVTISQFTGNIQGTVFAGDGVTPVPSASVRVLNALDRGALANGSSVANGQYQFSNVTAGTAPFVVVAGHPLAPAFTVEASGTFAADGETKTIDLVLSTISGTVQGHVFAVDGTTPVPGAYVELRHGTTTLRSTHADTGGAYSFANTIVGSDGFGVRSCTMENCSGGLVASGMGQITTAGGSATVDLVYPGRVGTIEGRVLLGDGLTTVAPVPVTVGAYQTVGSNEVHLADATTDATGAFRFANLVTPEDGVLVRVQSPRSSSATKGERTVVIPSQGATVSGIDLVLPVNMVTGTVRFASGSPVPSPQVFDLEPDGRARARDYADAQGRYAFFEVLPGSVTLAAQDATSGLTSTSVVHVPSLQAVTLDFTLPASTGVRVTVLNSAGQPMSGATVALVSDGLALQRVATTNAQGLATLANVPAGPALIQGRYTISSNFYGYASVSADIPAAGQPFDVSLSFATTGAVTGYVGLDGMLVSSPWANVIALGGAGPLGAFGTKQYASGTSPFYLSRVPPGPVQVGACDTSWLHCGLVNATLGPSQVLPLNIPLGNAVRLPNMLYSADGFEYRLKPTCELGGGGTVDYFQVGGAYYYSYRLKVANSYFGYPAEAYLATNELNGRQLAVGPLPVGSWRATRKMFVPVEGGFVRFLDIVSNPTDAPRQVTISVDSGLEYDEVSTLVAPDATGNTYAIEKDKNPTSNYAIAASVFSGAEVAPVATVATITDWSVVYSWTVTIPAGGSAAFLHFSVARAQADLAGAQAQAEALVNLTDSRALYGLTASEKAMIKNFVVK